MARFGDASIPAPKLASDGAPTTPAEIAMARTLMAEARQESGCWPGWMRGIDGWQR